VQIVERRFINLHLSICWFNLGVLFVLGRLIRCPFPFFSDQCELFFEHGLVAFRLDQSDLFFLVHFLQCHLDLAIFECLVQLFLSQFAADPHQLNKSILDNLKNAAYLPPGYLFLVDGALLFVYLSVFVFFHEHFVLQDLLGHHLVIELNWIRISHVVVQLTVFGLDHVGFIWTGGVMKLVVLVVLQLLLQDLFVLPGGLLLRDQTFGGAEILGLVICVEFPHDFKKFVVTYGQVVWSRAFEMHSAPFARDPVEFSLNFCSGGFKLCVPERYLRGRRIILGDVFSRILCCCGLSWGGRAYDLLICW